MLVLAPPVLMDVTVILRALLVPVLDQEKVAQVLVVSGLVALYMLVRVFLEEEADVDNLLVIVARHLAAAAEQGGMRELAATVQQLPDQLELAAVAAVAVSEVLLPPVQGVVELVYLVKVLVALVVLTPAAAAVAEELVGEPV